MGSRNPLSGSAGALPRDTPGWGGGGHSSVTEDTPQLFHFLSGWGEGTEGARVGVRGLPEALEAPGYSESLPDPPYR